MLDSEPKDKQKLARRAARGKGVRSALLVMLLGNGCGALYRSECGRGFALLGGCGGGRHGKKMKKFQSVCSFIQSPNCSRMRASMASLVPYFFFSKVKTVQSYGTLCAAVNY